VTEEDKNRIYEAVKRLIVREIEMMLQTRMPSIFSAMNTALMDYVGEKAFQYPLTISVKLAPRGRDVDVCAQLSYANKFLARHEYATASIDPELPFDDTNAGKGLPPAEDDGDLSVNDVLGDDPETFCESTMPGGE